MVYTFYSKEFDRCCYDDDFLGGYFQEENEMAFEADASERFDCVSLNKWINYDDLQDWLDILTNTDFFEQNSRKNAVIKFRSMKRERNIFNKSKQFPDEFYVCMGNQKISDIILGIMSLLDIGIDYRSIDIKNVDFHKQVKALNTVFCQTNYKDLAEYGIFKRISFEENYNLSWKD